MIRKIIPLLAALLLISAPAFAAGKIGVLNVQEVLKKSEPGQQAMQSLQEQFKDMKDRLDTEKADIEKMREELQKQGMVLSQQAKMDKEIEFKRRIRDFQDEVQNFQRKTKAEEQRLSVPIIETIMEVVDQFGKDNGYDLILDGNAAGVMFVNEPVNVTNQVIVEVNKSWRSKNKE
jgi:outer membrane protein